MKRIISLVLVVVLLSSVYILSSRSRRLFSEDDLEGVYTDELAGTWVLNDILDLEAPLALALADFCANEENYKGIAILTEAQISFDRVLAFRTADNARFTPIARRNRSTHEVEWLDNNHKTLVIDSNFSEVVNGGELLLWLCANATKI